MDIFSAAKHGTIEEVSSFLQAGIDINCQNELGFTPILYSLFGNNIEVARFLLENGADPDISEHTQTYTCLIHAVCRNRIEFVELLLHFGAELNKTDESGWTALHYAVNRGHVEIAEILINAGSNVNALTLGNYSPLYLACSNGFLKIAKFLLKKGAKANQKDIYDVSIFALAHRRKKTSILLLFAKENVSLFKKDCEKLKEMKFKTKLSFI